MIGFFLIALEVRNINSFRYDRLRWPNYAKYEAVLSQAIFNVYRYRESLGSPQQQILEIGL